MKRPMASVAVLWSLFVPPEPNPAMPVFSENAAVGVLRYLAYFNTFRPDYELSDLQFTVPSFWQTMQTSVYLSALDPDLSLYARHGGKLLLWQPSARMRCPPGGDMGREQNARAEMKTREGGAHSCGTSMADTFEMLAIAKCSASVERDSRLSTVSPIRGGTASRTSHPF